MIGNSAESGAPRRSVNADSFRRLTALLKKPAAPVPALNATSTAPQVSAPQAPEAAPAPTVVHAPEVLAPVEVAAPLPPTPAIEAAIEVSVEQPVVQADPVESVQVAEVEASAVVEAAEIETVDEASFEEPRVETAPVAIDAEPAAPEAELVVAAADNHHEPVAEEKPAADVEQVDFAAALEPPSAKIEAQPEPQELQQSIESEQPAEEPVPAVAAEPVVEPAIHAEPEMEPAREASVPVRATAALEQKAIENWPELANAGQRPSREIGKPAEPKSSLRRKTSDSFSLTPEVAFAPVVEPKIEQTPEQEAESAELAQSLMDMMAASASGGQPQERALAADTLLRLLPRLPTRTRINLAQRLAMMDAPPPFLVTKLLADDDLAICGPLLEDCMHISDDALIQLIGMRNPDKRRLMARRRRLSRAVSEALAATMDISAQLTLVRNQGAEIDQHGFALLAQSATEHPDLLPPLCTRKDLPVHFAFELFWHAPAQLRRYLLSRFLTDSENLTKILKITMGAHADDQAPSADLDLEALGEALLKFMNADASVAERDQQVATLAAAAKVKPATVERVLQDDQGEPLMALLKVLGVPRSMLEAEMHQFTSGRSPLIDPARNLAEVQAVFDQLSFTKARVLLTYWDWATTQSGPYAAAN